MKTRLFVILLAFAFVLAACQPAAPAAAPAVATAVPQPVAQVEPTQEPTQVVAEPILEVVDAEGGSVKFTLDDLKALPATEGQAGIKSSTGKITPPLLFKGISLQDLVADVKGWGEGMALNIVAKDGYAITYSYDQVTKGDFIAYDPATGEEKSEKDPLVAILAYERDGKGLDTESDGTLRLAIVTPKNDQVTDGHWAVKWVVKVEVKSLADEWALHMVGAITEDIDRVSFESCSAPGCHGAEWTDDKNQKWSGVPLFYLLGAVDDEIKHDGPAFNRDLANAGYMVEVESGDGFKVELDVAKLKENRKVIVANKLDGNGLVEKNFPLKLVGDDLTKKEMVSGIAKIMIKNGAVPEVKPTEAPAPTQAPAAPAAGNAALVITGAVEKEVSFSMDDLKGMEIIKESVEHPKKGAQEAEGVSLVALLEMAKPKAGAATVVITASDGFTAEAPLKDVLACKTCLAAFNNDGNLKSVMPGFQSNLWVKDIVKIEVK